MPCCKSECTESITQRKVSLAESGKSIVLCFGKSAQNITKIRIDGCEICNGKRADWLIVCNDKSLIVELKGSCVEHAFEQIHCTLRELSGYDEMKKQKAAIVAAARYPRNSTTIQRRTVALVKEYGIAPKVFSGKKREVDFYSLYK